jgi:cytochrome c peroxidase
VRVSEVNDAHNPMHEYVFTNPDGTTTRLMSPDPGRALITGVGKESGLFDNVNAFKIPTLWGVSRTAPYFHDNSARTLEDLVAHYNKFFEVASDPDGPGPKAPLVVLTQDDQADIVAYLKLLK